MECGYSIDTEQLTHLIIYIPTQWEVNCLEKGWEMRKLLNVNTLGGVISKHHLGLFLWLDLHILQKESLYPHVLQVCSSVDYCWIQITSIPHMTVSNNCFVPKRVMWASWGEMSFLQSAEATQLITVRSPTILMSAIESANHEVELQMQLKMWRPCFCSS